MCQRNGFPVGACRRANAYYSHGGALCENPIDDGNCNIAETIASVNLNGGNHTDSQGIYYFADIDVPYEDRYKVRIPGQADRCLGVPERDRDLYCNYVFGVQNRGTGLENCLVYTFEVSENGKYELIIKLGEFERTEEGESAFTIRINDEPIIEQLDLLQIKSKDHPFDLIFPFEVKKEGKIMIMKGFQIKAIHRKIRLQFCHGSCDVENVGYSVSAFAVNRFLINNK